MSDPSRSPQAAPARQLRIAVADDDERIRALIRALLAFVPGVEVVGEASDGRAAVALAEREEVDVFLLDVEMPLLDGIAAAELIRTFRPGTRIVLHTAAAGPEAHERAAALGLRVLDKTRSETVIDELLAEGRPGPERMPLRQIEALVLMALEGAGGAAFVVARADETVPFYDVRAAAELGLPYPAQETDLAHLRRRYAPLLPDGRPIPYEERPIARALRHRRPIEAQLVIRRDDGSKDVYDTRAIPFFDEDGRLLGAAHYFNRKQAA